MPELPSANLLPLEDIVKQATVAGAFQLQPEPLTKPFANIAMALSGGGFRAASYSLGTMSYLHSLRYTDTDPDRRVLDNVVFISSASGGSFTGMLYSMHVRKGKPFQETYKALTGFMKGQDILLEVLELINDNRKWTEGKSQNFINAFARVYNKSLFDRETFGVYWTKPGDKSTRDLEVCFNATEFFRGLSFRFQGGTSTAPVGNTGNEYLYFDKKNAARLQTLQRIRLGDIMAASSCFPAGFEPILYPKDFAYGKGEDRLDEAALKAALTIENYDNQPEKYKKDIGFMDGGIDDNQGVYSAMVADQRRRRKDSANGFGLVLVTDVGSYFMQPYVPPALPSGSRTDTIHTVTTGWRNKIGTIASWVNGITIGSAVLFVTALVFLFIWPAVLPYTFTVVIASVMGILMLMGLGVKTWVIGNPLVSKIRHYLSFSEDGIVKTLRDEVPAIGKFSPNSVEKLVHYLQNTPLTILRQMLQDRLNSMLSMVLDINLKQTRRLIFDIFFGNFYGKTTWQHRRVFNVIYELSSQNRENRLSLLKRKFDSPDYQLPIPDQWAQRCINILTQDCELLQAVADNACSMGTTLWFDEGDIQTHKLQDLIACGQFTTCAKLLEYTMIVARVIEVENAYPLRPKTIDFDETQMQIFQSIQQQVDLDWQRFKQATHYLVDRYETNASTM